MPTRIIREGILTSKSVNSLSQMAELFYRKLLNVADDYGRYHATLSVLLVNCYPGRLDEVTERDVKSHLNQCVRIGLVVLYDADRHLYVAKFRQQARNPSKFPEPDGGLPEAISPSEPVSAILQAHLCRAYNRPASDPWTYGEQCLTLETCRRPDALEEVKIILGYRPYAGKFFPQSIEKLLSNWSQTLDRARNHVPEGGGAKRINREMDRADRQLKNL